MHATTTQTLRLVSGRKSISFTTVKGTGACTVAGRGICETVTLDDGRAQVRDLLGQGWTLVQDMVLS